MKAGSPSRGEYRTTVALPTFLSLVPRPPTVKRPGTLRERLARRYVQRRLPRRDFTFISDDCWAGRAYAELGLICRSPFVGMGFTAHEYLDFLQGFREPGALDVLGVSSEEKGYPLIRTRHARLFGQHYGSDEEFVRTYERRRKTILWDRVFIKIDFGKRKYRPEDIARWNALKPPNSVALYPDLPRFRALNIHHGVALPDWDIDGARQFQISCRRFDIFEWLNHGVIRLPWSYRCAQIALLEQNFPQRLRRLLRLRRPAS